MKIDVSLYRVGTESPSKDVTSMPWKLEMVPGHRVACDPEHKQGCYLLDHNDKIVAIFTKATDALYVLEMHSIIRNLETKLYEYSILIQNLQKPWYDQSGQSNEILKASKELTERLNKPQDNDLSNLTTDKTMVTQVRS